MYYFFLPFLFFLFFLFSFSIFFLIQIDYLARVRSNVGHRTCRSSHPSCPSALLLCAARVGVCEHKLSNPSVQQVFSAEEPSLSSLRPMQQVCSGCSVFVFERTSYTCAQFPLSHAVPPLCREKNDSNPTSGEGGHGASEFKATVKKGNANPYCSLLQRVCCTACYLLLT